MKLNFKTLIFGFSWQLMGFWAAVQASAISEQTVVVTTFPIYQIVRNVTNGREGMKVELLLPSQLGCPHDYALTPQDLRKLAAADFLVINGLGLEEFVGSSFVKTVNPQLVIIDSSVGIMETLPSSLGVNPHLFVSPRLTAQVAHIIAGELSKVDPNGAAIFFSNAEFFAARMFKLAEVMVALGKRLKNRRVVQPHGVFDYLARDIGLEIVVNLQVEHGLEPSAADMLGLIRSIRKLQAGAIFTEPQYRSKVGVIVGKEVGIPVAVLDSVASGPENAPLDYYEVVMYQNLQVVAETLGVE